MQGGRHGGQLLLRRAGDDRGIERLRGERVRGDVAGGDGGTGGGLRDLVAHRDADGGSSPGPEGSEAPKGAPRLSLDQALDVAERHGVRLCSLCGAAQELDPVMRGFDAGIEGNDL
ncbi:DUF6233 domain-containing protein [Streptomyces sp. NPDC056399]|uniref:DUF6233 domain-containing protein n=1 Tax=Streptomyces sp. NPDC056399 TaxID=3345807 RepID=UPI0035DE7F7E